MGEEITLEEYKEAWRELAVRRARRSFIGHLAAYVIINAFMIFVNLWSSPHALWFPWVLAGWGIGLAFHGVFSRRSHIIEEVMQEEAMAELLAREKKRKEKK